MFHGDLGIMISRDSLNMNISFLGCPAGSS